MFSQPMHSDSLDTGEFALSLLEDGTLSLKDSSSGELYHNRAGAYSEAYVNYLEASGALAKLSACGEISVLDICFGLGYNSLVLLEEALVKKIEGKIVIQGIDKNANLLAILPVVLKQDCFKLLQAEFCFEKASIIRSESRTYIFSKNGLEVELCLEFSDLKHFLPACKLSADFVFHDPFSPAKMPELWTVEIFKYFYRLLSNRSGSLLTYSTAAAVRNGLREAGFVIGQTRGLGAKKGGTIGLVSNSDLYAKYEALKPEELKKLDKLSGIPYRDIGLTLDRTGVFSGRAAEQELKRLAAD